MNENEIELLRLSQHEKAAKSEQSVLRANIENLKKQHPAQDLKVEEARLEELDRAIPLLEEHHKNKRVAEIKNLLEQLGLLGVLPCVSP